VITVSPAQPGDAAAIAALLEALGRFYGAAHQVTGAQVRAALFARPPGARTLLARDGEAVAGMAAYSFLWPAVGATRSLYLKELYVPQAYRGRGVGRLLMRCGQSPCYA
jgi:predicted N-acetyltransferase YhbS